MTDIIKRINLIKTERNLNDHQIEVGAGLQPSSLLAWANGKKNKKGEIKPVKPSADSIIKLARFLNVSADYLLGLTDEYKPLEKGLIDSNKDTPTTIKNVSIKPAYVRNRQETVDMFMYRYQNVIEENYFWILVELCSHIKSNDALELFATLCNAMIEKGYPALEYYVEAHRYFTDGLDKPIVWNEACPKLTIDEKKYVVENIAKEISNKLAKDYAELLGDKAFRDTAKLYNEYPEELRVQILEMIINWLTKYILQNEQLKRYCRLPNDVLGRN